MLPTINVNTVGVCACARDFVRDAKEPRKWAHIARIARRSSYILFAIIKSVYLNFYKD